MKNILFVIAIAGLIPGCAMLDRLKPAPKPEAMAPQAEPPPPAPASPTVLGQGQSAQRLDTTTAAEKAAALAAPVAGAERVLGKVAVALGSPAEAGFWLRSPLVSAPGKGRIETAAGQSVAVDLLPGNSGAQLSLAAFRALGLSLTDLPEVTVYGP